MQWMTPLRILDSAQNVVLKQCSNMTEQAKWIDGFAGSGKTVLLVYAIQNYVQINPNDKVCIVVFTHALKDLIESGIAPYFQSRIPVMTYLHFVNKDRTQYDLVVVDEVQDVPANILISISKRAKKLLVAGDDAQSIYENGSRAEKIESILQPDRLQLPIVYRLTKKIINVIRNILPNNPIVGAIKGTDQGVQVILARADTLALELAWVWQRAKKSTETGHPSVVVLPEHSAVQDFMRFVAKQEGWPEPDFPVDSWKKPDYSVANEKLFKSSTGIYLQYLGNRHGSLIDSDSRPIVYVMTYHSIKGLEFRSVFLPLLNSDTIFWRGTDDINRRLFFVGTTRSYSELVLSYHSQEPHPYVQEMPQDELCKFEIPQSQDRDGDSLIF